MENTMFKAVKVVGGRKFKGECYQIEGYYESRYGYAGSGVCPLQITSKVRIWNPATAKTEWVTEKFVQPREVTDEQYKADFAKYADITIDSTVAWCRTKSEGKAEEEVIKFAYNVIRKNHYDFLARFVERFNFKVDVESTVKSTVAWAIGLGYRSDKTVRVAARALVKKGISDKENFSSIWTAVLSANGLGKYSDKYFNNDYAA